MEIVTGPPSNPTVRDLYWFAYSRGVVIVDLRQEEKICRLLLLKRSEMAGRRRHVGRELLSGLGRGPGKSVEPATRCYGLIPGRKVGQVNERYVPKGQLLKIPIALIALRDRGLSVIDNNNRGGA